MTSNACAIKTRNNPKKDVKREGALIKATLEYEQEAWNSVKFQQNPHEHHET